MPVRSSRLAAGRIVGTTQQVIYTVPLDRTTIVKSVILQNDRSSSCEAVFSARNSDSATIVRLFLKQMASNETVILDPWWVLTDGDDLRLQAEFTNEINYWISGSVLDGDPS